jgi:hypothetical protein
MAKQMSVFRAALKQWDRDNPAYLPDSVVRNARRAAFACMWMIENVTEDTPDRTDIFFAVREIYRKSSADVPTTLPR